MATKWFSNKAFKSTLHRLRSSKRRGLPALSAPSTSNPKSFREAFERFDTNGDGKISCEELRSFLAWAGEENVPAAEVEMVMREYDWDGDGLMDYGDFVRLVEVGRSEVEEEEDLRTAFETFEAEKGSGFITPDGLRRALGRLGEARSYEECVAMIRAYDLDGNGVLDYHEFHRMMA